MGITRLNNNVSGSALNRINNVISSNLQRSLEQLSSGLRIHRGADDASGLRISSLLQSQLYGLNESFNNAQAGINLSNVADQSLGSVTERLNRIRELTIQAGNGANDAQALQAIQAEISQNVSEIDRVASTTQFGSNFLLDGSRNTTLGVRPGTQDRGVSVDTSNLTSSQNFLNLREVRSGSAQILSGEPTGQTQTINTGITNTQDIAVTQGRFTVGGTNAASGDLLTNVDFDGARLQVGGTIAFSGVLADGATAFSASFQISTASTLNDLTNALQSAIDQSESSAGVNTTAGTNAAETNVAFNAETGRIDFRNGAEQGVSRFNADFTITNAANQDQHKNGTTRAAVIGGYATGAQTGNSVTAFTGSTFATGDLTLDVTNVVAGQNRTVQSSSFTQVGDAPVTGETNLIGSIFNGVTLAQGDTIQIKGTNADGSTFSNTITISTVDGSAGNGAAITFQDLIDELNVRDRSLAAGGVGRASGFASATAELTGDGAIQVRDDIAGESQTTFSFVIQDRSSGGGTFGSVSDNANLVQEGIAQQATLRINGGPLQTAEAGSTLTLFDGTGVNANQITFTLGTNLSVGTDTLRVVQQELAGSLNGGPEVRFTAGAQDIRFVSGVNPAQNAIFDFGPNIDLGRGSLSATVFLSASGNQANFQLGANAGQMLGISFGDVRANALGLGEGRNLNNIDITREGGLDEVLAIVDEALNQVDEIRSRIGAFSNRLEESANRFSIATENLLASRSQIVDANFATEATRLMQYQLLLNSNQAVQSQTLNLQNTIFSGLIR